jgi:hypothetical protein
MHGALQLFTMCIAAQPRHCQEAALSSVAAVFCCCWCWCWPQVKRFESLSSQRFLQGIIVAIITGLFWWQRGTGGSLLAASDVVGLLFFELLFPAFTALFTSLFTFPNDYRMLLKERASGM